MVRVGDIVKYSNKDNGGPEDIETLSVCDIYTNKARVVNIASDGMAELLFEGISSTKYCDVKHLKSLDMLEKELFEI